MVLVATVAGADANSYLTVADANTLAAADAIHGAAWLAASDADKELMLFAATRDVEVFKGNVGPKYSASQARAFPRATIDVLEGVPFLPAALEEATYCQAVHLLVHRALLADAQKRRAQGTLSQQDANGAWQAAIDDRFGYYAPRMTELLASVVAVSRIGGRTIVAVPVANGLGYE